MFSLGDGYGKGTKLDDVRLLKLLHKPIHFQFALPIKDGGCDSEVSFQMKMHWLSFLELEFSKQVQRLVMVDFPRALPTQTLTWPQIEFIVYCLNLFITNR